MTASAAPTTGWRATLTQLEASRWSVLIPMAVAAVLGVATIGSKSVWLDEAFSIGAARLPLLDMLNYLWRNELYGTPYYVLLHFWSILGTGEATIRVLSVLIGVGAVGATWAVGRRFGVGFLAALILAVLPMFIQQEQDARVYTLLAGWTAITTLAYLRFSERLSRGRAAVYIACAALMIYIHPVGGLVVIAHAIHAAWKAQPGQRRAWFIAFALIGLAWLPMLRFMLLHRDKISWIAPLSAQTTLQEFVILGGGYVAGTALLVLLLMGARRDVVTLWLAVPIAGILIMSALFQPSLQARYLIAILPAAAIMAARVDPRAVAVLIAISLVGTGSWYVNGTKDDWRTGVAWVEAQAQPTDGILFSPGYGRMAFFYYGTAGEPIYPTPGWQESYMPGLRVFPDPPAVIANPRVWRVDIFGSPAPAEVLALLAAYQPVEERSFGAKGPDITLLERVPVTTTLPPGLARPAH